jgi:N-acetylglutamate synthase-like GNAT family acetyltransferase
VIVAERGGEILGLVVVGVDDEGFLVDNVAVDPSHQGTGVGKALLEHAEIAAHDAGFDSIYLYTHERMTENLRLYSRIGYVEYDRRQHGDAHIVYCASSRAHAAFCELAQRRSRAVSACTTSVSRWLLASRSMSAMASSSGPACFSGRSCVTVSKAAAAGGMAS